ncbi:PAS domain-containing sensor histidine kinase [Nodularia spumigena]|jgi:two-component system, NtrC family, sensor kinase|uniref:PAS domain-containing sensor histidine kinase n=1 Tax=Nodularia spumigena TaxID=70799 RepID=UPI002B217EA8|nr:PAS domain-containing sensor histidine kinase [Nodularia spumigena]MEA5557717.1 PAS domain-containing sensor histidine kinase [Nodularia spumigena CH309]
MNIPEPATYNMEAHISASSLQNFPDQQPQAALQMALASSGLGWWNWNLVTNKTYFDPQWKHILGYKVEEITNHYHSFEQLVHPEDLLKVQQVLQEYLEGYTPKFEIELRMLAKSGEWKWILSGGCVFEWDEFGKPILMTGTHRDITQEKLFQENLQQDKKQEQLLAEAQIKEKSAQLQITQRQLLQNDQMANLGQIVVEMANEIYHPVNFIYDNFHPTSQYAEELIKVIELYQYYYPKPNSEITSYLQEFDFSLIKTDFLQLLWSMQSGSERLQEIVSALRNFSNLDADKMQKSNLHEGLDSVIRILQHRLKEKPDRPGIEVIKEFGELPLIDCYPGELNQVFMNILNNAIDALEERMKQDYSLIPQIFIRTEVVSSHLSLVTSNESHRVDNQLGKKQKVVIHIYDNGKGILPHIKRRIFEPFFTTKAMCKSKGLGLAISQQIIVEKHHGKLRCNSQLGQGTEFVIEMNTTARHYADMRRHANF